MKFTPRPRLPIPVPPTPTRRELVERGINIVVAIPPPPTIGYAPFFNFWRIAERGWPIMELGPGAAEIHRNQIALTLQRDPKHRQYTHVLMLDADHLHRENVVELMARWVLQDRERLVVAGLNFKKGGLHEPLFRPYSEDGVSHLPVQWETRTLFRINWAGTGCMLVDRRVFDLIPFPYYDYVYPDVSAWVPGDNLIQHSEDVYFCNQCFKAGVKMYLDPGVVGPHIAQTQITELSYFRALEMRPDLMGEGRVVQREVVYK